MVGRCLKPGKKWAILVQAGLDIAGVITHTFSVDEYQTAFGTLHSGYIVAKWFLSGKRLFA